MWSVKSRHELRQSGISALLGSIAVGVLTLFCFHFRLGYTVAGPLFLLTVIVQSLWSDFLAAAVVSVLAVASLDYFFLDPLFSFAVTSPLNILALVAFLVTALVITSLVSRVGAEARLARLQADRLDHLYRLAQQLLGLDPEVAVGQTFLDLFAGIFGTMAVCMFDPDTAEVLSVGSSRNGLADKTKQAFILGLDRDDPALNVSVRCLRVSGKVTGAMGFEGLEEPEATAGAVTALAAALQERSRAFRRSSQAAAATQIEIYRTAVLDALAHEFKTPLATILTAAGGLREAGPLDSVQQELAETVESEASRLGNLTSRMLRVARLDREEVKPRMEVTDINTLLEQLVDQYSRPPADRQFTILTQDGNFEVLADPELLRLAVSQILDNACKYSPAGSAVEIAVERQEDLVAIRVSNNGPSIPSSEQARIFERFYRGKETRSFTSGSGLGLYVARKIALAHGGALDLDSQRRGNQGVTFCLAIPQAKGDPKHAAAVR
jgi:two-component system sensor histidine kinase KdpD